MIGELSLQTIHIKEFVLALFFGATQSTKDY